MKRIISLFLAVLMFASLFAVIAHADSSEKTYTDKYGEWVYVENEDNTITIVRYNGTRKNIVVPPSIDGLPVTVLGDGAFSGNTHIMNVILPNSLTSLGDDAFSGCKRLEALTLPYSVKSIGDRAFKDCDSLKSLFVPNSVSEFGEDIFEGCDTIDVKCNAGSAAEIYLVEHKDEIPSVTIYTYTNNTQITTPPEHEVAAPEIKGELVTWSFGKTINGRREYTLVLIDTIPDWNVDDYRVYDAEYDYYHFDSATFNRFVFKSLTKYDGESEIDLTNMYSSCSSSVPHYAGSKPQNIYRWDISLFSDSEAYPDVTVYTSPDYTIHDYRMINKIFESIVETSPEIYLSKSITKTMGFIADGTKARGNYFQGNSVVKSSIPVSTVLTTPSDATYTYCSQYRYFDMYSPESRYIDSIKRISGVSTDHENLISGEDSEGYDSGFGLQESYGSYLRLESTVNDDCTYLNVYSSTWEDGSDRVNKSFTDWDSENGEYTTSSASKTVNSVSSADYTRDQYYYNNGEEIHNKVHTEYTNLTKESINFSERVINAETKEEAQDALYGVHFSNEADEHTQFDSAISINANVSQSYNKETNLDTGEVRESTFASKSETLSNHQYVGETGKYNGWDWNWQYTIKDVNDEGYVRSYTVTEYRYTADTDQWTKTVAYVNAKYIYDTETNTVYMPAVDAGCDFKTSTLTNLSEYYNVSSDKYTYDESDASGSDNWRFDGKVEDSAAVEAIVKGNTSIEDEDGTLVQSEVKAEMLEQLDEIRSMEPDTETSFYDVAVGMIENGAEMDAA